MTTRLVITCDGSFDGGKMPCRGAFPGRNRIDHDVETAATAAGWSLDVDGDLCPAHSRIHRKGIHPSGLPGRVAAVTAP